MESTNKYIYFRVKSFDFLGFECRFYFLFLLLALLNTSCDNNETEKYQAGYNAAIDVNLPVVVEVENIQTNVSIDKAIYMGKILPYRHYEIVSEVEGTLTSLRKKNGEEIKKGDILAVVKPPSANFGRNDYIIRSPIDGRIGSWVKSEGQYIKNDSQVLNVYNQSLLKIYIYVTENDLNTINKKNGNVGIDVSLGYDSKKINLIARIVSISMVADPKTLLFPIELELKNPNDDIVPLDTWIKVEFNFGSQNELFISPKHIRYLGETAFVMVYSKESSSIDFRSVKTGAKFLENKIQIISGISKDDIIIVPPNKKDLYNGQVVIVKQ